MANTSNDATGSADSGETQQILAAGRFVRLVSDGGWEYAERVGSTGVVTIVAVTDEGRLLLAEQYRRPVGRRVIELPAGLAGDIDGAESEEFAAAARRELLEETGYRAERMTWLTEGPSSAGLSSEVITFFLATGLEKTGPGGGDGSEQIEVHEVPLDSAAEWLAARAKDGTYVDPKVYAGLYFAMQRDRLAG
jgi:ADP-ribose pyrophosphatase